MKQQTQKVKHTETITEQLERNQHTQTQMRIRPHETFSSDSVASADQNVTFKLHGSHSRVGFQMEELVHNTSNHSDSALEWKETIQLQTFPNYCPDFKCWRDVAKSKSGRRVQGAPERDHSRDTKLASFSPTSSEPRQAFMVEGPAGSFYCSKAHTGGLGPQTVLSDSFIMNGATRAKKDFSSLFI